MANPDIDGFAILERPRGMIHGDRHDGEDTEQHAGLHRNQQRAEGDREHPGEKPAAFVPDNGEGVAGTHREQGVGNRE